MNLFQQKKRSEKCAIKKIILKILISFQIFFFNMKYFISLFSSSIHFAQINFFFLFRNFDSIYDRSKIGFNSGDVIITIFDHGTLSFMVNGIDKGVAFKGISGRFYPAATLSCIEDTIHIFGEFERLSF